MFKESCKVGIDEVGYGSWAGPLYICALQFLEQPDFQLFDSKKISEKKRNELFEKIKKISVYKIGVAKIEEINEIGLAKAYQNALKRAVEEVKGILYMDGVERKDLKAIYIKKGDSIVAEISAASIIAKVSRDMYMKELSIQDNRYGFEKHKGYGTKLHIERIRNFGLSANHRIRYKLDKYL